MKKISQAIKQVQEVTRKIRATAIDIITSISADGKTANTETFNSGELRDLKIMLPYGISSSTVDSTLAQVIINDKSASIVGVYDKNRPSVRPGELILYTKFDCQFKMLEDGSIVMLSKNDASAIFDASGNITLESKGGAKIIMSSDGNISMSVNGTSKHITATNGSTTSTLI